MIIDLLKVIKKGDKMRKIFRIFILFTISVSFAFAFFGGGFGSGYSFGEVKPKKGFWAEDIIINEDGTKTKMKIIYAGETNYKGKKVYGVETQFSVNGQSMATMALFDSKTYEVVKVATQTPMGLMCQENTTMPMAPGGSSDYESSSPKFENPKDIKRKYPKIKHAVYKTPTGKKVDCMVYKTGDGEIWLNKKIGIVKAIERGKLVMYLNDFGENATPAISLNQAVSCQPMSFPMMPMGGMGGMPQ